MKNRILSSLFLPLFLTYLTLLTQSSAFAQIPSNGLVGYWPFNGNANDESGNGNNGTVNGATLTTDRFGNSNSCYSFDGNDNIYVQNAFFNNGSQYYTINMWARLNSLNTVNTFLNTSPHCGFALGYSYSSNSRFYHYKGADPVYNQSACWSIFSQDLFNYNQSILNQWVMVTIVKSNNTYTYFVNGIEDKVNTSQISPLEQLCGLSIGSRNDGLDEFVNGKLDDISIYNRALTPAEITQIYTSQTSTVQAPCPTLATNLQTGLVGYWPFCGNANDESGNGNNGTVNGATLTTDRFGNVNSAYSFDGVNDWIETNNYTLTGENEISISCWIKTQGGEFGQIISSGNQNDILIQQLNQNTIYTYIYSSIILPTQNNHTIPDINDTWSNVIITYDGSYLRTYLNGVLIGETLASGPVSSPQMDNLTFGAYTINGIPWTSPTSQFYNGSIDDICLWNRALTPAEISQLYTDPSTTPPLSPAPPFSAKTKRFVRGRVFN